MFRGGCEKIVVVFTRFLRLPKIPGERERGARSARPVGETARSKPNEAGRTASELASDAERPCRIVEPKPFRALIVPGGVYGGGVYSPVHQLVKKFF